MGFQKWIDFNDHFFHKKMKKTKSKGPPLKIRNTIKKVRKIDSGHF
jgi:hypothetical protein